VGDDEILEAYERELDPGSSRTGRGFWVVVAAMAIAVVVLLVEIFANRPLVNAIAETQNSLRTSHERAQRVFADAGTFAAADADGLADAGGGLSYRGPDEPSRGTDDVSVFASATVWAAAVQARPDACFFIEQTAGEDVRYGVGTTCTGRTALGANESRW
jgi:hypothetical protein